MKVVSAEFIRSCTEPEQMPRDGAPEIAVVGRSNVGKSSVINSLLQRRKLAKVSGTPGKTQTLNVIRVSLAAPERRDLYLVDLPGYGYANVAKSVRQRWAPMIERYLRERKTLAGVILLVDARGVSPHDANTIAWLRTLGREPIVVVTKADKLTRSERAHRLVEVREALELDAGNPVVGYSSVTHEGRDELWQTIRQLIV